MPVSDVQFGGPSAACLYTSDVEYDIAFGQRLAEIAARESDEFPHAYASRRVSAYMARLSMEITLKALLEKAGMPITQIRAYSHRLRDLLDAVARCAIKVEVAAGISRQVHAGRVRGAAFDFGGFQIAIGDIVDPDPQDISKYPNEIRYGSTVIDISPPLLAGAAVRLSEWAREHWDNIEFRTSNPSSKLDPTD